MTDQQHPADPSTGTGRPSSGMAVAGFVLALCAVVLFWLPFANFMRLRDSVGFGRLLSRWVTIRQERRSRPDMATPASAASSISRGPLGPASLIRNTTILVSTGRTSSTSDVRACRRPSFVTATDYNTSEAVSRFGSPRRIGPSLAEARRARASVVVRSIYDGQSTR